VTGNVCDQVSIFQIVGEAVLPGEREADVCSLVLRRLAWCCAVHDALAVRAACLAHGGGDV
jgi:hypothetical protein